VSLAHHNQLTDAEATRVLRTVCTAPRWVDEMVAARPYASVADMIQTADHALAQLTEADLDAALAGHPKIGSTSTETGGAQSRREQSGVDASDAELAAALADGNRAYEERFGRIYLVCASGRSGPELLAILHERLRNDAVTELAVTRSELGKINRLRLERLVAS